jgi:hypothetical protein
MRVRSSLTYAARLPTTLVKLVDGFLKNQTSTSKHVNGNLCCITPSMLKALCEHLTEKPNLYGDKIRKQVNIQSISRALASVGLSKGAARHIAKERHHCQVFME